MVGKMLKYSFILLNGESEAFLETLQELGVVDIERSSKPIDEKSSEMLEKTLRMRQAIGILENFDCRKDEDAEAIAAKAAGMSVEGCKMQNTMNAVARLESLKNETNNVRRTLGKISVWGDYSKEDIERLASLGVRLHWYCVSEKKYDPAWEQQWPIETIETTGGNRWFVVASRDGEEFDFPVPEIAAPEMSPEQARERLDALHEETIAEKARLLHLKENALPHMREGLARKSAELDRYLASEQVTDAAEGYICTIEGFVPEEDRQKMESTLEKTGVLYICEEAREEDNPPIKLKNNGFARMFECLTGMYGMPVYGEWDPTPILSIFFLLFFAFCMGDAGYGLILIIYGILQDRKIVNIGMFDGLGKLIATLGVGTTVVGFFLGTAFGVNLAEAAWVPDALKSLMITGDIEVAGSSYAIQMVLALAIGVFHICLAMTLKAILYTKRFGFKANISTWGWLLLILGGIITAVLAMVGLMPEGLTKLAIIIIGAVSALAIFIFNTPGRNPLMNIGAGLWDTYNMATGILGDVLSYIRLYALGLAGGMLGGAFNELGAMVLGTNPTWQWLPFVLILLFGHVLNLLMSCLGAFVHPLRLTFVEYFKNSGYEGKGRLYNALKK